MSCTSIQADLVAALTGDLASRARRTLDGHLKACGACRAEAGSLRRLLGAITPDVVFPRESEVNWNTPLTCARVREELSTILEDGSPQWDEVLVHLARCPSCSEAASAIGEVLALARRPLPEEKHVDWDAFARETARLALVHDTTTTRRPPARFRSRLVRTALPLAASLLAVAGLAWLSLRGPTPGPPVPQGRGRVAENPPSRSIIPSGPLFDDTPETQALLARTQVELAKSNAARYLADSGTLLMGLSDLAMRCDRGDKIDIGLERELSTRLLRRKQFLERDLQDVEVARAVRLADEIEDLLVDIASLEPCIPQQRVQEIEDRVRQRQLMMRIEMISTELNRGGGRA